MTRILITVPDQYEADVLAEVVNLRQQFEQNTLTIEVKHEVSAALADEVEEAPAPRKGRTGGTVRNFTRRASDRTDEEQTPLAPRPAVTYEVVRGQEHAAVSPTPARVKTILLRQGPLTAKRVMEIIAQQDETTVEHVQKSVESSLHALRTKGIVRSRAIEEPRAAAADRR